MVKVGYVGNKRYLRTVITKNGGTSIAAGAVLVKGRAARAPGRLMFNAGRQPLTAMRPAEQREVHLSGAHRADARHDRVQGGEVADSADLRTRQGSWPGRRMSLRPRSTRTDACRLILSVATQHAPVSCADRHFEITPDDDADLADEAQGDLRRQRAARCGEGQSSGTDHTYNVARTDRCSRCARRACWPRARRQPCWVVLMPMKPPRICACGHRVASGRAVRVREAEGSGAQGPPRRAPADRCAARL